MKAASRSASLAARTLSPRRRGSKDAESAEVSKADRKTSGGRRRRRTPRGPAAADLPDIELSEEDFLKEWGITKDQEENLLIKFRQELEAEVGPLKPVFDKYYLRRFLRARQHDLARAKAMFRAHLKWRKEFGVDTIIEDFHFFERDAFLTLYPQGYHKTDRLGRPVYIQHLGQINVRALSKVTTEERMLLFHIQEYERALRYIFPACSLIAGKHVSQTLAIMDLKGVGLRHLSGEVKRILSTITRTDQDNYPETLGKTLIINAPTVFRAIWAVVKPMLDPRTQAKIQVCSADYLPELTRWVDPENIPSYLGGKSQGSLLDDVGPWHDQALVAEIDAQRARTEEGAEPESPAATAATPIGVGVGRGESSAAVETSLLNSGQMPSDVEGGPWGASSAAETTDKEDAFYDVSIVRLSSASSSMSAYMSADEGYYSSDALSIARQASSSQPRPPAIRVPSSDGESYASDSPAGASGGVNKPSKTGPTQISILARVRALEEKLPSAERGVRRYLSPNEPAPSRTVGQGTLLGRVSALEKAMDTLLKAQEVAMEDAANDAANTKETRSGCCACCCMM